jgi:CRP/FNR family transcriptional regulator
MKSVLETLRSVPFLTELPEATVVEVARRCIEKVYMRGEVLFLEGDPPKGLLVVREGAVKIFKTGDGGREQILEIEGPGRSVAELPLFDGRPYPASCAAVHDSVVLVLPPREFRERLLDLFGELAKGGATFELDLSHQELAARIGTVREIVSRTLSKLVNDGTIRVEGKTVTLLSPRRGPAAPR